MWSFFGSYYLSPLYKALNTCNLNFCLHYITSNLCLILPLHTWMLLFGARYTLRMLINLVCTCVPNLLWLLLLYPASQPQCEHLYISCQSCTTSLSDKSCVTRLLVTHMQQAIFGIQLFLGKVLLPKYYFQAIFGNKQLFLWFLLDMWSFWQVGVFGNWFFDSSLLEVLLAIMCQLCIQKIMLKIVLDGWGSLRTPQRRSE